MTGLLSCILHSTMTPEQFIAERTALGLSQSALAEALGVDQGTISRWEAVSYTHLTLPTIYSV